MPESSKHAPERCAVRYAYFAALTGIAEAKSIRRVCCPRVGHRSGKRARGIDPGSTHLPRPPSPESKRAWRRKSTSVDFGLACVSCVSITSQRRSQLTDILRY
jgi:hypothetical protein